MTYWNFKYKKWDKIDFQLIQMYGNPDNYGGQIWKITGGKTLIQEGSSHWTKISHSDCRYHTNQPIHLSHPTLPPLSLSLCNSKCTHLSFPFHSHHGQAGCRCFHSSGHLFLSPGKLPNSTLPSLSYHIICFYHNYLWDCWVDWMYA